MFQGVNEAGSSAGLLLHGQMLPATAIIDDALFVSDEREDRIRAIFGLRRATSLPCVDKATLQKYFYHLATHLSLPFSAIYYDETGPSAGTACLLSVIGLPPPSHYVLDPWAGLLCTVRTRTGEARVPLADIGVSEDHANHRLIEDYWYWFWNWRRS